MEENKELMTIEEEPIVEVVEDEDYETEESSSKGFLIGSVVTAATIGVVAGAKKLWKKHKGNEPKKKTKLMKVSVDENGNYIVKKKDGSEVIILNSEPEKSEEE